ncbi:MAG: hypothetical protein ISR77_00545 [Pirellulaceae bacterium]|nr:hypothetical protein [Pirellulaceae bacterium]
MLAKQGFANETSHREKNQNHMLPKRFHALIAGLLVISSGLSRGAENIGGAKQLFVDNRIIGSLGSAKRVFKQAVKTGPLLSASTAWERRRSLAYPTVRREGVNSWKIWYRAGTPSGERAICYATSKDGVTWTKPKLGIYPHNGGNNNIVLIGSETFVDTPSVFKEDDGYYLYCIEGDVRYVIYHSPDGIHNWRKASRGLHADHARIVQSGTYAPASHNYDICLGVYDQYQKDYIFHFKVAHKEKLFGPNDWQRKFCQHRYSGSLARIQDTLFPLVRPHHELADKTDEALEPGTLRAENYGMGMYPQEDGSVIGFSWLFSIDGHNGLVSVGGDGTSDGFWHYGPINVMLVYSRDIDGPWLRPTTTPILPRGPAGSWDGGMVHTANTPVEVPRAETSGATTDQVWMYYGGANHLHNRNPSSGERDHRFGIAKWRIDGFAALEDTDGEEDTIISRAIRFSGNQLTLNADVESNGYIKVKFRPAEAGADLKGWSDAVTGDHQKHVVRWGGEDDIGNCAGKEVILEFRVKDAALYSLDFTPDA